MMVNAQRSTEACPALETRALVNALRDAFTPTCILISRVVRSEERIPVDLRIYQCRDYGIEPLNGVSTTAFPRGYNIRLEYSDYPVSRMWDPSYASVRIGYYGEEFAKTLAVTSILFEAIARDVISEEQKRAISARYRNALKSTELEVVYMILNDGIESIGESFVLLTAEKVPGFKDSLGAMEALTKGGFPNKLSLVMPFGLLGKLEARSNYMNGVLDVGEDGRLRLSGRFIDDVRTVRKEFLEEYKDRSGAIGLGCPVGKKIAGEKKTGIQALTESFMHVFRIMHKSGVVESARVIEQG